jgi:tol-pal system protein YbgF
MTLRTILTILVVSLGPTSPALADQRLSDLLLQIQRLQQEVQQLRGQVELQQHEISTLKRQQREQYVDLDSRLQARSAGPAQTPASGGRRLIGKGSFEPAAGGGSSLPPASAGSAEPAGEKEAYRIAFDLLKQRNYDAAVGAFEGLLARYPNGEFADNARYWLGETYYVKRDYAAALIQFQRVLANYPLSPKVPGSMLKIGYIHSDRNDWKRARATLQDVTSKFPDSAEARQAESRLDRMTREGH